MGFLTNLFRKSGAPAVPQTSTVQLSQTVSSTAKTSSSELNQTPSWQKQLLESTLRQIVGDEENFELLEESLGNGKVTITLVTDSNRVEIGWCYVQDIWNQMLHELETVE
jgi:hypothetical protein